MAPQVIASRSETNGILYADSWSLKFKRSWTNPVPSTNPTAAP